MTYIVYVFGGTYKPCLTQLSSWYFVGKIVIHVHSTRCGLLVRPTRPHTNTPHSSGQTMMMMIAFRITHTQAKCIVATSVCLSVSVWVSVGTLKMREIKNAGKENAAQDRRGGKCRKRKCGTRLQGWKMREKDLTLTEVNKLPLSQTCPRFDTILATVHAYDVLKHRNTASIQH